MKLIDADKLKTECKEAVDDLAKEDAIAADILRNSLNMFVGLLEMTDEYAGVWIKEKCDDETYSCSQCGAMWLFDDGNKMKHCPDCGARMKNGGKQ